MAKELFMKGFIQALVGGYVRPDPIIPQQDQVLGAIQAQLLQALRGEKTAANALTDAEVAVQNIWRTSKKK